jgi:hypothetical protein
MPVLFVARSARLARWASDVGFGRNIYKLGVSEDDPKALAARGWAGEADWTIVRKETVAGLSEDEAIARLGRKEKPIDPDYYPKLKGAQGVFRVAAEHVENHIIVSRALAGASDPAALKLKPADFAAYLMHNAQRG